MPERPTGLNHRRPQRRYLRIYAFSGNFSGTITDTSGTLNFGKDRSTLTLSGNNTYRGTTTVIEGLLEGNGTHTGGGNGLILRLMTVPEPAMQLVWLLLAGLGVGLGRRRRK